MRHWYQRAVFFLELAIGSALVALLPLSLVPSLAQNAPIPLLQESESQVPLPLPAIHPLPPSLAAWQDSQNKGDYFAAVQPVGVGYLIWSTFPVRVYIEPPTTSSTDRSQEWVEAIAQAVEEWTVYLPLQRISTPEAADISIWRTAPPLRASHGAAPRARSAETRYELYINRSDPSLPTLAHRFTILLRPSQSAAYIRAAARHELGHALGIWGHSPDPTDALYFAQVRHPPHISVRDVNTLKQVYGQPTRLGWRMG